MHSSTTEDTLSPHQAAAPGLMPLPIAPIARRALSSATELEQGDAGGLYPCSGARNTS